MISTWEGEQHSNKETSTLFHERKARFRTHTSLLGGLGPGRCLEVSVPAKTGKSKRANKTTPTRHLPVFPNAFDIDFPLGTSSFFSNVFGGASARATVTSSRR